MDNFYYQVHPDIPFIDLRMYQQTRLIASSNNRVYLYCSSMQQIAVKEIVVPLEYEKTIIEKLKQQYSIQSDQREYIIQIYGMAQLSSTRLSGKIQMTIYICMEYMPYCLQDHIEYIRQQPESACLQNLLIQGLQTHSYLQSLQICHGDIKPQNILINDLVNPTVFKTCDFDNMVTLTNSRLQPCIMATQMYHAPEIQQAIKQGQDTFHYNPFKAQVYSFGLCLLQMHPQNELQITPQAFLNIEQLYGNNIAQILQRMLDQSNFQRPDFKELYQLVTTCGIESEPSSDILKSQHSNLVRNTPDMYDFFRRESKYPNQDSIDYDQLMINNFSEPRSSDKENLETLISQAQKTSKTSKSRKCCSITYLKTISVLCVLLLISLFLILYFVIY